ncbi:chitinase [Mucilaginibacter sp. KACC 22063]|uniref:chitinase n=1 Tax=Mucilaginibacter sp. KACC 22063 TaxID=3025666 RepID=UPI002365461F|nr:chitinase [Mucilaginibacter sp. KACC 22063]WDF54079.1 chitinase [Mucilaginibacter sp. KACC 22063]
MKPFALAVKFNSLVLGSLLIILVSCGNTGKKNTVAAATNVQSEKKSVSRILTEKQFNDLFPQRDKFYSYAAFIRAADELANIKVKVIRRSVSVYQLTRTDKSTGKTTIVRQDADWNEDWAKQKPDSTYTIDYGQFCTEKDATTNKKELAAFFAQIAHETRHGENGAYNDGLMLIHENNTSLPYIAENDEYPPVKGQKYYGRGPMQISYNGNYGYASDCIFGDEKVLLNKPSLVETDPVVAFKTAIYFWMTSQTKKPSAHDVMTGKWQPTAADIAKGRKPGFGMTINIINGEVECNHGENMYNMTDRIGFYQYFLKKLGVSDPNCACSCGSMKPYQY